MELYQEERFIDQIEFLVDNNSKIHGKEMNTGKKIIKVFGKDILFQIRNLIIIITSDQLQEIYDEISELCKKNKNECYAYPTCYSDYYKYIKKFFNLFPTKRMLLFRTGSEPHENAIEIIDFLKHQYRGKKYKIVQLGEYNRTEEGIVTLDKDTFRKKSSVIEVIKYCNYYCRSRFLFYENERILKMNPKQTIIFLNHGAMPLKNVSDVLRQPESIDYAICPAEGCSKVHEEQYGFEKKRQIYVMPPRVFRMLKSKCKFSNIIGDTNNRQVILWLPTFRQLADTNRKDSGVINPLSVISDILGLDEKLKSNNQILVIKKHPREKEDILIPIECNNIYVINDEEILAEKDLCLHDIIGDADALLTDYSGIYFEYLLFNRPIGYVVNDIDSYHRGFAFDNVFDYMPGAIIQNENALIDFFDNLKNGKDEFEKERLSLIEKLYGDTAYENGAEKLITIIDKM